VYAGERQEKLSFDSLLLVTSRDSENALYHDLLAFEDRFKTLRAIGDCNAPGTVAAAVYDGHSAARHLESGEDFYAPLFTREIPALD
jgi:dimethylamine/trimethylamine dehydrogenase